MRLIAEPMRTHFSLIVLVSLLVTSCSSVTYDHREEIARATLFTSKGVIDERAFSGALIEKFSSANSPPAALAAFVESLGGKCSSRLTNSLTCTIPQSGGFCVASRIDIEAVVADGAITSIRTKAKNDGC